MRFKRYFEATDIFGFDHEGRKEPDAANMESKPIKQFDTELMMDILSEKTINNIYPTRPFLSEIVWGRIPGAIKLEVDPGFSFHIKKLNMDKQGNRRWIHKRMFQLNRTGYGGLEDSVAQEVFEQVSKYFEGPLEGPSNEPYSDLENLVHHIYSKMKRLSRPIFIPEGIKKLGDNAYIIQLGVRGQGVEAPNQRRVEQNQTMISYDSDCGTIRIFNYNVESGTGTAHQWKLMENDLDCYFFPTQTRDEISEIVAVHMKYY